MWCWAGNHLERKALRVSCTTWKRYLTPRSRHIFTCYLSKKTSTQKHLLLQLNLLHDYLTFFWGSLSVCVWHRQLAEGQHRDPSQISSLCTIWSRRGKILLLPCPLLQLCWRRRALWPNWGHHSWRQAWSENTHTITHILCSNITVNDPQNVKCSGSQIPHLPQAKLSPLETQTHQSLCLGKHPVMPKSWWDTTLKPVLWAVMSGSRATTNL